MFPNLCQNPFMKIWSPFKMMQDLEVIKKTNFNFEDWFKKWKTH